MPDSTSMFVRRGVEEESFGAFGLDATLGEGGALTLRFGLPRRGTLPDMTGAALVFDHDGKRWTVEPLSVEIDASGEKPSAIVKAFAPMPGAARDIPDESDFETQRIVCRDGPALKFRGRVLHEESDDGGGRDRWTVARLWETAAGNWIAEMVRASDREGEHDIVTALVVERPPAGFTRAEQWAVLDHFGWRNVGRGLARKMKWSVTRGIA